MKHNNVLIVLLWLVVSVFGSSLREIYIADENLVCNVKKTCVDCLRLSHCSWCPSDNTCFSKKIETSSYCNNVTVDVIDHGFSLEDNARCACHADELVQNCSPPGAEEGVVVCSDRGKCVCGRCICNTPFDSENPTKFVVGEYCDFDNFSCDGPRCTEGPYPLVEVESDTNKPLENEPIESI